jgi:zinc protease
MVGRFHSDYYTCDLLSDVLSHGQSSRLYQELVKTKEIFTSISSFLLGTIDPGLMVIGGRVKDGIALADAEAEVNNIVEDLVKQGPRDRELDKVKSKAAATLAFGEVEVLNRAMNLAFASLSGDASLVNKEADLTAGITSADVHRVANDILREENASVMYYQAET